MQQKIIILDFGSQTTQLIGRRVRELDTFCEILPYNKFPKDDPSVIGVILSGSPYSVHDPEAFKVDLSQFIGRLPVLGICYGAQFISHSQGGKVEKANTREYGRALGLAFQIVDDLLDAEDPAKADELSILRVCTPEEARARARAATERALRALDALAAVSAGRAGSPDGRAPSRPSAALALLRSLAEDQLSRTL